jgi:hypothetical protein
MMKGSNRRRLFRAPAALLAILLAGGVEAQEAAEGVSGTVDKKRRSPIIFVDPKAEGRTVKILIDLFVPNEEYREYPVKVEFYVNRQLFATQIRSKELPGPLGVVLGPDVAVKPFNYSIVATLLHPNRQFVSVAQGAIVEGPPTPIGTAAPTAAPVGTPRPGSLRCVLSTTVSVTDEESPESSVDSRYVANDVLPTTGANGEVSLSFTATAEGAGEESQNVQVTLRPGAGNAATGTISFDDVGAEKSEVSGTMSRATDGAVTAIDVRNESGDALDCDAND